MTILLGLLAVFMTYISRVCHRNKLNFLKFGFALYAIAAFSGFAFRLITKGL